MKNSITIYILTYNRCNFLGDTIRSVLNQTYSDFDLYVLDNHSDDDTEKLIGEFNDSRLIYIRHDVNLGGVGNIVYAINNCTTDFCVIFHDDDIMCPDYIEKVMSVMINHPDAEIVCTKSVLIDYEGKEIVDYIPRKNTKTEYLKFGNDLIKEYIKNTRVLEFPTIMYRLKTIKENNILPNLEAGPGADVVFYNEILSYGGYAYELQKKLIQRRIHLGQGSDTSLLFNELLMFEYMKKRYYFADVLREMKDEIPKVYARNSKHLIAGVSKSELSIQDAYEWLKKYGNCWEHSAWMEKAFKIGICLSKFIPSRLASSLISLRRMIIYGRK